LHNCGGTKNPINVADADADQTPQKRKDEKLQRKRHMDYYSANAADAPCVDLM
jgi:hypothetical protein